MKKMDVKNSLALKKKRELLGSINKRKMSLRKNIDTLKQNECRLDITQITKCVFLGSLCLKPVPQLFDSPILLEELDMRVGNVRHEEIENFDQLIESTHDIKKSEFRKRNGRKKCLQTQKMKKKSLRERNESKNDDFSIKSESNSLDSSKPLIFNPDPTKSQQEIQDLLPNNLSGNLSMSPTENDNRLLPRKSLDEKPSMKISTREETHSQFELIIIKQPPQSHNNTPEDELVELYHQNNEENSDDLKNTDYYENESLKGALTPELILSDSDDDTIDQLMFNIMDIKIGPNVFDKEFFDIPANEYKEFSGEFNEKSDSHEGENVDNEKDKKYVKRTPQCKICSQVFPSYVKLKKHRASHSGDKPYLCLQCGENHTTLDQLIAHLRKHQGKRPYVCKKCNKGFKTMKALENHQPVHVLKKVVSPKKIFKCETCKKEFRKLCDLERHTRVHTGEKPSVCNICHRRFQQAHNLNKHLLIHTQEKPFQCDICNKKFGRNDVLNRHLLTHSVKKPNHCEICMKSFIRVSQLLAHKEKYHPQKKS